MQKQNNALQVANKRATSRHYELLLRIGFGNERQTKKKINDHDDEANERMTETDSECDKSNNNLCNSVDSC